MNIRMENWKELIEELHADNPDLPIIELHSSSDYSQYGENHALRDCERATWFAILDKLEISYVTLHGAHDTVIIIAALTPERLETFSDYLDGYPMVDFEFASDMGVNLDDYDYSEWGFDNRYGTEALDYELPRMEFVGQPPNSAAVMWHMPDNWNDYGNSYPSEESIASALAEMGYTLNSDEVWIEPSTVVIYRKWDIVNSNRILAVFPEILAATANYPYLSLSYEHIGQHGACDYKGILQVTTPATPDEYADLHQELTAIGYNLVVRRRCTAAMDDKRREQY